MRNWHAILLALTVASCASVKVTPPQQQEFDSSREYALSFESVWLRAVDWFANHHVTIDKIEKASGLLTAKYLIETNGRLLDCGDIQVSGTLGRKNIEKDGALNLTVRELGDNKTKVNVNFFGKYELQANDAWDGDLLTHSGRCISTGVLEKEILGYIGS